MVDDFGFLLIVDGKGASAISDSQLSTLNSQLTQPDEHSQTVILTPDFEPRSRLPIRSWHQPDSGFGELVFRYSGATVPDFHGVPCI